MDLLTGGLILGAIFLFSLIFLFSRSNSTYTFNGKTYSLSPGPRGLPIIGYLPFLKQPVTQAHLDLMFRYGPIFRYNIGKRRLVILSSQNLIREAYQTKGDNFIGRNQNDTLAKLTHNSGILFTTGSLWQEHRRFTLRALKDFGFGRNLSEEIICSELDHLCNTILDKQAPGTPVDSNDLLTRTVSNVICIITMGERPGYEDKQYSQVIAGLKANIKRSVFLAIETIFPFLTNLGPITRLLLPQVQVRIDNLERAHDYIRSKINTHHQRLKESSASKTLAADAQDLIDVYLMEQSRLEESGEAHTFTDWQLIRVIHEMFIAGTDTTSNSLTWLLLYMTQHPDVQKKVHAEIEDKIGHQRHPSMKDRASMPYTSAVIDEGQRLASIVPMVAHYNFQPDTIGGYYIPVKTTTIANIYGVHHDPKIWSHPEEFYPQHFFNEAKGEYMTNENLIPFVLGKRSCLGESLARMEMFVFFVGLMQRYRVELNPEDVPRLKEILRGNTGAVRSPNQHGIIFHQRHQ